MQDRGALLIPAFSAGRTQELLYEIEDILHRKSLNASERPLGVEVAMDWPQLPVILDSPLDSRFTQACRELKTSGMTRRVSGWRRVGGRCAFVS